MFEFFEDIVVGEEDVFPMFFPVCIVQQFDRLVRIVRVFRLVKPHGLLCPFRFGEIARAILRGAGEIALELLKDGQTFYDDGAVAVDEGWGLASWIDQCEFRASGFLGVGHDSKALADVWDLLPRERDHDSPARNDPLTQYSTGSRWSCLSSPSCEEMLLEVHNLTSYAFSVRVRIARSWFC